MSSMSSVGGISESPDVQQDIGRLLQDANALAVSLSIPRFKVVLCMLQLAEMRASLKLNAGDEILVLVRKEVIPSLKAIKDITAYLTTERQPERVEACCYGYLRDTPIITDLLLKAQGSALACDLIFLIRRDGQLVDCVAANFVGVS